MDIFYSLLKSVTEIEATYEIRSRGYKGFQNIANELNSGDLIQFVYV